MNMPQHRLGDVCEITMGQAPESASYNTDGDGLPLVAGAGDLGDLVPNPSKYTTAASKISRQGDIILCIRATIGDINWSDQAYCLGRGVAGLRANSSVLDQRFLWHFISARRTELEARGSGSTFKQVSRIDIADWLIPTPTFSEQQRIAAILDKADSMRRKRQEALRLADEFLRATFFDLIGDPVANPRGWPERSVREIGVVTTGNTPDRSNDANFGDEIEWIKSDNINTPSHWLTIAREGLSVQGMKGARIVPAGSTLMTCIAGSPACIGNVAMADRRVAFNQQINAITPKDDLDPKFLYLLLLFSKARIQATSTNSMKGMVSKGALEKVRLIWPPKSLQERMVQVFDKVASLRTRMEETEQLNLYASLQAELLD